MDILLTPPLAFLIYIPLVGILALWGKKLAGPGSQQSELKTSTYSSGEQAPEGFAAPGYAPFFLVAFFFAILHLGMLVLGLGGLTLGSAIYLAGLLLALVALILG